MRITHGPGAWTIEDLGNANGTYVDGVQLGSEGDARTSTATRRQIHVVRIGRSLVVPWWDVRAVVQHGVTFVDGLVYSGRMASEVLDRVDVATRARQHLFVTGKSGKGKEGVARRYHASSPHRAGPFVPVNCAQLEPALADAALFGAKRGSHSAAHRETKGFFQEAHNGVLFLDEIGELAPGVQAKLLRAIQTKQVTMLGATEADPLDVLVVAATNRDVQHEIDRGTFRDDLYARLAQEEVHLPDLNDRPEEIPFLVALAVQQRLAAEPPETRPASLTVKTRFREACLLRDWGARNVRELSRLVQQAVGEAIRLGASSIDALSSPVARPSSPAPAPSIAPTTYAIDPALPLLVREAMERMGPRLPLSPADLQRLVELCRALERNGFDVTKSVAEVPGLSRTSAYELMKRAGVRAKR